MPENKDIIYAEATVTIISMTPTSNMRQEWMPSRGFPKRSLYLQRLIYI